MSLASQVTALAARIATECKSIRTVANGKEPAIAAGTTSQWWRGDKSWQTIGVADVANNVLKQPCRVASQPRSLSAVTSGGNIALSGTQTLDGVAVVAGDRVLVNGQTSAQSNGIYVVATGAWSRAGDADTAAKLAGAIVPVLEGTMGGSLWQTSFKATDTLGTTTVPWQYYARSLEVQNLLLDSGWVEVAAASGFTKVTLQYRRIGSTVYVKFNVTTNSAIAFAANGNITSDPAVSAALPSTVWPITNVMFGGSAASRGASLYVDAGTGQIRIQAADGYGTATNIAAGGTIRGDVVYFI